MTAHYKALRTRAADGRFLTELLELPQQQLTAGQVRVAVAYSSLNYKDALSATGNRGVTRDYPHTLGTDACGEVIESTDANWQIGDKVLITGFDLGMNSDGGLAEQLVCPGDWLLALPEGLSEASAMLLGTAGLTAGLCVDKLQQLLGPLDGKDVLVSGSTGGVGCLSVALLAKLGAKVTAVSGKKSSHDWLRALGAHNVVATSEKRALDPKPISKSLYHAAIDTVGGNMLANFLKIIHPQGAVACCGMAAGNRFESSVFPFILRGVSLLGVDSAEIPLAQKAAIWQRFASDWALSDELQHLIVNDIKLSDAPSLLSKFLNSAVVGRYRVRVN